jgi:hypothetical protein
VGGSMDTCVDFATAKHTGDLIAARLGVEIAQMALGLPILHRFFYQQMLMAVGRYLGQMSDAEHLVSLSELAQEPADAFGNGATNAHIDFIKNQRIDTLELQEHL